MNIDSQIRQWASLVRESLDESDDALISGSQTEDKIRKLIIKLIEIDPECVSDEDYKSVGMNKSEYIDMIKDTGDFLDDITKESTDRFGMVSEFEDWKPGDGSQDKESDALLRQINDKLVQGKVDVSKFEKVDEIVNELLKDKSTDQIRKLNDEWNRWAKKGGPRDEKYAKAFFAAGDSIKQTCINKLK